MHQSTWTYKWLVKWDSKFVFTYLDLSWHRKIGRKLWKKTSVRYLERKIARILKLLLIPWKLFFSQTNHIATAWKWKLAITEPTQTYVLHFRRHEHAVFSILKLWLLKQKGKHFAFSVWHMKLILCALLSRFSPTELIRYLMQSSFF